VRRALAERFPVRVPREMRLALAVGESQWELRWRWPWTRRHLLVLLLVLALGTEIQAVYPFYFRDYVARLPSRNYAISLELARAIDDFADDGVAYIKTWPYWYDGNAVRAQLQRTDQSWHNELLELRPGQPPLVGVRGKIMVIVHPQDTEALRLLREAFPKGIELTHPDYDGKTAFITFYGER